MRGPMFGRSTPGFRRLCRTGEGEAPAELRRGGSAGASPSRDFSFRPGFEFQARILVSGQDFSFGPGCEFREVVFPEDLGKLELSSY